MKMKTIKYFLKKWIKAFWIWLKPVLNRFFIQFRRTWKKYHLTKSILLFGLTVALLFSVYLAYLAKTANVDSLRAGLEQTTKIIDNQEEEAGTLYDQKGTFVELENISSDIQNAVTSTEDQRFYQHRGYDLIGIGRAALGFVTSGGISGGGSTITQQLAKNAYLSSNQTIMRKLRELFLAIEIEKHYTKEDILEMYLNNSYFGNGVWGVEDASHKYFGKSASEVTLAEAATIAAMLKAPSNYNPIDHYDSAIERRNVVLNLMVDTETISEQEAETTQQTELTVSDGYIDDDEYRYPYYFDAVINEAVYQYDIPEEDLLNNGYTIYTNLDQDYQQQMDAVYANDYLFQNASDGTIVQSASIAIDPENGGVNAVIGGRGEYTFRGYNRATQMKRQPGSVIKPLGVYVPALESDYEIDSLLQDELTSYGETNYQPENLSGTYSGEVPMYEALANSLNAPTVWLLNEIGINKGIKKLEDFGLTVTDEDNHLGAIALGGMDKGVSPLEIASAYAAFANKGVYTEPHFISRIVDATGAIIVDNRNPKTKRVMSEEVAEDMNRMLLNVYSSGTAKNNQPSGYQVAGKTGTTQTSSGTGATDQWIVGMTPDIVLTSWMGFDRTTDDHYLLDNSSQGVGMVMKSELEHILPYTQQTAFTVEDIDMEVADTESGQDLLEQVNKGFKDTKEVIRKGTNYLLDGADKVIDFFKNSVE
ncbi:penicillin-binding protein 2A [Marinilactibacillus piezotolerans]|uniref:Penicillin-binding protein 2A n=1 Tax=Marinilactibacillus piezotolerans TaxID=258723 RepID=A0A1I4AAT1_9LACT|nr:PBP1A family penicillin-binding protein [Marinilactibacillus piezotolerans]SFK53542.1 penicillin-binding protein 2A [Marinilactibacillus piezotolerans]